MKVSVDLTRVIDTLLAGSALKALCADSPAGLLSTDCDCALRRVIAVATGDVASGLTGRLKAFSAEGDCLIVEFDDSVALAPEALALRLEHALTVASLHQLAVNAGDSRRAEAYGGCLREALSSLCNAIDTPPPRLRLRPSYL